MAKKMSLSLGDFLREQRKPTGKTLEDIAEKAKQIEVPEVMGTSLAYFSRLERGEIDIKPEYGEILSQLYDVDTLLLISIMPRQTEGVISLKKDKRPENTETFVDLKAERVVYYVPNRRLSGSSVTVSFLSIESQGATRRHDHYPSHNEILINETGTVIIYFPDDDWRYTLEPGDIIQFKAGHSHYIKNIGSGIAKLIVIKEYEILPESVKGL